MIYYTQTKCGEIKGIETNGMIAYKGIRYATAKRFEYPKMVERWEETYDACEYKHCCYQPRSFYDEEFVPEKAFYYNEFRKGETYTYSEDCLFLNIWTPVQAKQLPVLIYIHGGGFVGGCGHEKHFDEPVWPNKGVIAVTINYRLGPLGFICLPELKEKDGHTGNYGLYDQYTAIKWVKENIEAFGGDPDNITIMGQSAGAMSVQQHCLSPMTKGLFNKAIMSSGGGVSKMMSTSRPEKSYEFWHAVMKNAECETVEELQKVDVEKYFAAWQKTKKEIKGFFMPSPVIDDLYVVGNGSDLLKEKKHHNIHYMCGSTSEDIMPPIIFDMAKKWCKNQSKESYTWFFDRQLPGDDNGAWHSSDLWYWFGTLANGWRPFEKKDYELSDQMTTYLCNFVKTGNPNDSGLPLWQPSHSQSKVLCFGEKDTHMGNPSMLKLIKTMITKKNVGE